MRRLLDYDADTGTQTWHSYDHHTQETTIETVQDVAPYLRASRAEYNHDTGGALGLNDRSRQQIKDSWWKVASIPVGVQYKWMQEYGINIHTREGLDRATKLLDHPDWRYLRTNPGRIT